jgi:hypothetical protein
MTNQAANQIEPSTSFRTIDCLRDPDGVVALVTERIADGRVSFSISKEYDRNGKQERTAYLSRRHIDACRRLLDQLADRLELLEDQSRAKRRR